MRRTIFVVLGAILTFSTSLSPVLAAQDATPTTMGSAFADLGLPELEITATAFEFTGIPDELDAGRYLITLTAEADVDFGAGIEFIQPSGVSVDEFVEMLAGPPDATAGEVTADGTPFPDTATPAGGEGEMEGPPDFYYESLMAGGVATMAGQSAEVVLDLTPGEWVAWSGEPEVQQPPVVFEVVGEMPTDLPEPDAGATITMDEYEFGVSDGELVAGSQVVRIDNAGDQPHFMIVMRGPDTMTDEQVEEALAIEQEAFATGVEPEWGEINPEENVEFTTFTGTQSTDTSTWILLDLEPGMYALLCFVPDREDGEPHAYHGMYIVVEIGE